MIIVSAYLTGLCCRFDGGSKPCEAVVHLVAEGKAIPVCPEQLGGLTTPRLPAEQVGEKVVRSDGTDLTLAFRRGAQEALKLADLVQARTAILKAGSPSCGCGKVYNGNFDGTLVDGDGVFAKLCKGNGITVKSEEDV